MSSTTRKGEEGMALLVVMVLMGVMLTAGFALASTVDTQSRASRAERVRDSTFNLAESALNAQVFLLARDFPGLGADGVGTHPQPYATCGQGSSSSRCPSNAALTSGGSADLTGATWQTEVHDNGAGSAPNFYADSLTSSRGQLGYDVNGDGQVWVRAQATAEGHTRTLVALVRSEYQEEDLPHAAVLAGSLDITNNGNKELLRAGNGPVTVRCDPSDPAYLLANKPCLGQPLSPPNGTMPKLLAALATQVTGVIPTSNPTQPKAMTDEARLRLRATAIASGTYYTSCPTAAQLTGKIVYVDAFAGNCSYTGNDTFNSATKPGTLILERASVTFGGTTRFYGVVYAANVANALTAAVQTEGHANITGGVLIDGATAQMVVGSSGGLSGVNLVFDVNAYRSVASIGSAGIIQNTWREIKAG